MFSSVNHIIKKKLRRTKMFGISHKINFFLKLMRKIKTEALRGDKVGAVKLILHNFDFLLLYNLH